MQGKNLEWFRGQTFLVKAHVQKAGPGQTKSAFVPLILRAAAATEWHSEQPA